LCAASPGGVSVVHRFFPRQNKFSQPALIDLDLLEQNLWLPSARSACRYHYRIYILYQKTTSSTSVLVHQQRNGGTILKLYRQWAVRRANPSDRLRRTASPLRNEIVVTSICLPRTLTAVSFAMPSTLCFETLQALVPALLSFDVTTPVRVCGLDCLLTLRLPTSTPLRSAMLRPYILTRCIVTEQIFARLASPLL
jgi:hypothetical protein